jgi:hypothetical protein
MQNKTLKTICPVLILVDLILGNVFLDFRLPSYLFAILITLVFLFLYKSFTKIMPIIYLFCFFLLSWAAYNIFHKYNEQNIQIIMQSLEEYRVHNNKYPNELTELVPRYLNKIPRSRECLISDDFYYLYNDKGQNPNQYWIEYRTGIFKSIITNKN